jgi:23S rRNA pseudouridine1911/1915/1917 synthase
MCINERNGKDAVTHWEVIKRYRGYTHVQCRLETGRTHQIRVHMASIGHPILGDVVYGRKKPELGQSSQVLHAGILCFRHPRDARPVMVMADLPEYFKEVLEKLERMG